ncbi:DNA uptake porin HofQ [Cronobacter dublinensis]
MIRKSLPLLLLVANITCAAPASQGVSLIADETPVVQLLLALAESEQLNLVIAPGVEGVVSLHLQNVPWQQAFQMVAESARLRWQKENNILRVYPEAWEQQKLAQREASRQQQALNLPLVSETVTLRYAEAAELATSLAALGDKLMTPRGSVTVDKRTNRLLIRDTAGALRQVQEWVAKMDIPVGQVELAAHIVTINQQSLRELGVKWSTADAEGAMKLYHPTTISADLAVADATTRLGFNIGRIDGRMLEFELSALEQKQKVEIIASPRLLAAHQQPASIKQGSEIPYQVSSGESGATSVEFKEAVLGMEVTPTVGQGGRIRLKLRISQNMPGQALQQADGEVLAIDKQEIETQVEVKDGETLALGGIFQQKNKAGNEQVPLLGNIPLFGSLFRHDGKGNEKRELVVFITPHIINGA